MAYNNNIPQASDQLSQSQADILANFQAIKTLVDINHVTFDVANQGKHKWVSMPVQSSDPTTAASEMAMYTKSVSGVPELFIRRQSDGSVLSCTQATLANPGYTYLPSGLLIKWGTASLTGNQEDAAQTVNYQITSPAFTTVFGLWLAPYGDSGTPIDYGNQYVKIGTYTASPLSFTASVRKVVGSSGNDITVTFNYIAIGV